MSTMTESVSGAESIESVRAEGGPDAATDDAEPIISVKNIGVEFGLQARHRSLRQLLIKGRAGRPTGKFWALRDVSFDVPAGQAIGVVGRNWQGKTTLLKLIAGVMLPDEGTATVRAGVAPLIALRGGFAPDLTARDNIYLVAGLHGMDRAAIDEKFDQIVEFAEIQGFLDTPFRHFSSGMRVRLAFSVVSELGEPILLVDEGLAVGDKAFKKKCYAKITSMLAEGRTLFLVSHAAGDLKRFCDRGLYLRGGRLIADGPMDDVLEQYREEEGGSERRGKRSKAGGPRKGKGLKRTPGAGADGDAEAAAPRKQAKPDDAAPQQAMPADSKLPEAGPSRVGALPNVHGSPDPQSMT
jgi:ABC-2 type transport system ATP-binding protein